MAALASLCNLSGNEKKEPCAKVVTLRRGSSIMLYELY
ncbi:hypothetical protein FTV88_0384 [Heliorestis convoluta]|uniref:Uncharacterized protein n=1 Tax=Heliorestis convoluta TaxID=356322 RepID=A0A5Q2MYR7_9FIRM|nr:hypothetical protein FTV88_0384 [Heliorestis convoluta]